MKGKRTSASARKKPKLARLAVGVSASDDLPPLNKTELAKLRPVSIAKRVRWKLGLSQPEFAERYGIPLGTLRDWEQHRSEPDQAARSYLQVIEAEPKRVAASVKKSPALV